jgi:hypothetical protein
VGRGRVASNQAYRVLPGTATQVGALHAEDGVMGAQLAI